MLFGVLMYPGVIANVSTILEKGDTASARLEQKHECTLHFAKYHELSEDCMHDIESFFDYYATKHSSIDERAALSCLPKHIQQSAMVDMYFRKICRSKIFTFK